MRQSGFPGHELQERRNALKLQLHDVAVRLNIPVQFLVALERGDLQALPSPCYVRGFLKTYCRLLECESETYIAHYDECVRPSLRFFRKRSNAWVQGPSWFNECVTWLTICGAIVLAWLAYAAIVQPDTAAQKRAEAGTIESTFSDESLIIPK